MHKQYPLTASEYDAPEIERVLLETSRFIAVSDLEDPEEGEDFEW